MQKWTCRNCSHGNGIDQCQCAKCRFEPIGLDLPSAPTPSGTLHQIPPELGSMSAADMIVLGLLTLLVALLGWMAGTLPPSAREPFALHLLTCVSVGAWLARQRRKTRRT